MRKQAPRYTLRDTEWWCDICGASGSVRHRSTLSALDVYRLVLETHAYNEECRPECDGGIGLRLGKNEGAA